jgi:hypothetical protein
MKNLENFGVQELSAFEIKKIQGGGWLAYALGFLAGAMIKGGEGLERSGFNSAGANK